MSKINSGLGWSCDKEYLIKDKDCFLGTDRTNIEYTKYNDTPAIAIKVKKFGGFNTWCLVSNKQDAVLCNPLYLSFIDGKANIGGVTWFLGSPMYGVGGDNDPAPHLKWLNENSPIDNSVSIQDIIKEVLAKANVIMEEK